MEKKELELQRAERAKEKGGKKKKVILDKVEKG